MIMRRHSDIVTQNSETFINGASLFRLRRLWMCWAGAKERERERKRVGEKGKVLLPFWVGRKKELVMISRQEFSC